MRFLGSWWPVSWTAGVAAVAIALLATVGGSEALAQTGGFDDVPDDAYYSTPVAELSQTGVLTGCEEFGGFDVDNFCPGDPIDRKTMAIWVVRILDGQDPPQGGGSRFNDVDCCLPALWPPFIERMAELGVTSGCGDGSGFCPNRNTTRAEMAVFLSRAFDLPAGPDPNFSDVPADAWYADDVARLKASGITAGCGDGTEFCSSRITTRAEMATFLHAAISGGGGQVSETERDVLGASRSLATEIERDTASIDLEVHYCGQSEISDYTMSDLMTDTELIRNTVKGIRQFYLRQSGGKSRINITTGTLLWPDIDWDDPNTNLDYWSKQVFDYWNEESNDSEWEYDPCADELQDKGYDPAKALILADVKTGGIVGYAYNYGVAPAVAATVDRRYGNEEKYLGTVAHEIGHASYGWYHPWDDKYSNYSSDNEVRKQRLKNQAIAKGEGSEEHHLAKSIMSYNSLGRRNKLTSGRSDLAYVACYQRKLTLPQWVKDDADHRNCELLATRPAKPTSVDVSPGNRLLTVSWVQPVAGSDDIERYHVSYRSINGGWIKWKPNDIITSRRVTIDRLTNGVTYQIRVAAENGVGIGRYSDLIEGTPGDESPIITLTVGDRVQRNPDCPDPDCRWLHIDTEGFGPGPHTLACAHDGVHQTGASRGVFESTDVDSWPANRACFFQYPLNKVFVIVGAERRGDTWYGGTYSAEIPWPDSDPAEVRISWGTDASDRSDCPPNTDCRNLSYEYIGDWGSPPYTVECWGNGQRGYGPFQWSGRPHTGCYYWGGTAQVVINGVRSNTITFPGGGEQTTPTTEVRISWGTDASDRSDCPPNTDCRNLSYEYIGDWGSPPYTVECWGNGQRGYGPFQWSGRPHTGCYYWGGTAQVVINGVRSNTITFPGGGEQTTPTTEVRISWGTDASTRSDCPPNTDCRNLSYEYIGDWGSPPYTVECWGNGQRGYGPFQWSGRPHTGCYYWGGTAQVVINGVRSNTITFPGGGEQTTPTTEVRISWGTDASTRSDCPPNTDCRNLSYEYIGDWGSPPYTVECWGNGQRGYGPFQWSGRPHTGCYYWGGTAQVVINGVRSNTITFPGG